MEMIHSLQKGRIQSQRHGVGVKKMSIHPPSENFLRCPGVEADDGEPDPCEQQLDAPRDRPGRWERKMGQDHSRIENQMVLRLTYNSDLRRSPCGPLGSRSDCYVGLS